MKINFEMKWCHIGPIYHTVQGILLSVSLSEEERVQPIPGCLIYQANVTYVDIFYMINFELILK